MEKTESHHSPPFNSNSPNIENLSISSSRLPWIKIQCKDIDIRWLHTSNLYKHYVITFGGFSGEAYLNDITLLDTYSYELEKIKFPETELRPRGGHTACIWDKNKIVVFGGSYGGTSLLNETVILELSNSMPPLVQVRTIQTKGNENLYRWRHTADIYENKMYVFGGAEEGERSSNQLWCLDLEGFIWRECKTSGDIPSPRRSHCTTIVNKSLYLFGGRTSLAGPCLNDFWKLDLDSMKWHQIKATGELLSPRGGCKIQEHNGCLYVFGGYDGINKNYLNDLFMYDIADNYWVSIPTKNKKPEPRSLYTFTKLEGGFLLLQGTGSLGTLGKPETGDIFYLPLDSNKRVKNYGRIVNDALPSQIPSLLYDTRFSDVTFVVEDQTFPAHKVILAANCKYFENMFESGMIESHSNKVTIEDINPVTFQAFLNYIYCNEIKLTEELALDLLELSDKWMLADLKDKCKSFLLETLSSENLQTISAVAEKLDDFGFLEKIIELATILLENETTEEASNHETPKQAMISGTIQRLKARM